MTLVTNFTDVDDKIIKRAEEEGASEQAISERYIAEYFEDMEALGVWRATHYPKATEHIPDMIELVRVLLEKGYAYKVGDGDVYFRVHKFGEYGKLSGRTLDALKEARVEPDERKENPEDFALWKAAREGEPSWDAPWGRGRPGWHIECSAMSGRYLGPLPFDIHGGGKDLIFPHHENEMAQTEAAYGKPMARFWLHNGFINIDKEKMSKSLGNVFNLREAFEKYPPAALRLFLLGAHYRSDIVYTPERLSEASTALARIVNTIERVGTSPCGAVDLPMVANFKEALNDDLNTPAALAVLFDGVSETNRALDDGNRRRAVEIAGAVRSAMRVLGLTDEAYRAPAAREGLDALIGLIGETRALARKEKAFAVSDFIRERLAALGYEIRDLPDGKWEIKRRL